MTHGGGARHVMRTAVDRPAHDVATGLGRPSGTELADFLALCSVLGFQSLPALRTSDRGVSGRVAQSG